MPVQLTTSRLLDREHELAAIGAAVGEVAEGATLLIVGPPGIGKTSLLDVLARRARAEGMLVLQARGAEQERTFAYGIARQLFERLLHDTPPPRRATLLAGPAAHADRILASTPDEAPQATPGSIEHALHWFTANLADEQPVALVVDDAQWADTASLGWLLHLVRRLEGLPLLLAVGWRTGEPGTPQELLDAMREARAVRQLQPEALSDAAIAGLVRGALGTSVSEQLVADAQRASGGNPFLLAELLRSLTADPAADVETMTLEAVARFVRQRVVKLGPAAEAVAEAVAVLGRDAATHHVAALTALAPAQIAPAADALAGAHVLAAGPEWAFIHPLVRAAVYGQVPAHRRASWHRDVARRLEAEGADINRIALHAAASAPDADPWIAGVLERAGREALLRGAATEARALLARALAEPAPPPVRARVMRALGQALLRLDPTLAVDQLEQALALTPDVRDRARIARDIAAAHLQTATGSAPAVQVLDEHATAVARLDRDLHLSLEADRATAALMDPRLVDEAGQRLRRLTAGLSGATSTERCLLGSLAYWQALTSTGTAAQACRLARRALEQLPPPEDLGSAGFAWLLPLQVLIVNDDEHAAAALDALSSAVHESGSIGLIATTTTYRCYLRTLAGDLLDAEAEGWAVAETFLKHPGREVLLASYFGRVLVDRGLLDDAERVIFPGGIEAKGTLRNPYLATIAHLRREQGRWEDALAAELEVGRRQEEARLAIASIPWRAGAAVALSALGRHEEARPLAAEQVGMARAWGTARWLGIALRAQGIAEGGQHGIDRLRDACDVLAGSPAHVERVRALLELGAMLRRANRRAESREPLREAMDLAHRCGATLLAARAQDELRATGARPRKLVLSGVESLTASERRVCRLAADGLSNPQIAQTLFVARNTVETHLRSAYRKLDIKSREELPAVLGEPAPKLPRASLMRTPSHRT